jgi:hypothetical protein
MNKHEGTIGQALTDAKERLEGLHTEVGRYEEIVHKLSEAFSLSMNGAVAPARREKRQATARRAKHVRVPRTARKWDDIYKELLTGSGVFESQNRKGLAKQALKIRGDGNYQSAYAALVKCFASRKVMDQNGVILWRA